MTVTLSPASHAMRHAWALIAVIVQADGALGQSDEALRSPREALMSVATEQGFALLKRETLPSKVDLSPYFPTAGSQGSQGSCLSWATGYGWMSFRENLKLGRTWSDDTMRMEPQEIFSPAFLYHLTKVPSDTDDCFGGAFYSTVFRVLQDTGCCKWEQMPYHRDVSSCKIPIPPAALDTAAGYQHWVSTPVLLQNDAIVQMKHHLAMQEPILILIWEDSAFVHDGHRLASPHRDFIWAPSYSAPPDADYHGLVMVGYDDADSTFLVLNSYGLDWGRNGYCKIPYATIPKVVVEAWTILNGDPEGDAVALAGSPVKVSAGGGDLQARPNKGEYHQYGDLEIGIADVDRERHMARIEVRDAQTDRTLRVLDLREDHPQVIFLEGMRYTLHFDKAVVPLFSSEPRVKFKVTATRAESDPHMDRILSQ